MRSGRVDAAAWGYFLLLSIYFTWPLLPRMTTALSGSPDSLLNAWALGWSFHILPRDPLSLFDANIFFPRSGTLAYSEHLFGITVLVWPVYAVTGNLPLAYNTAFFSSFLLSGIGMYLLVREITRSRAAALVSGTIFLAAPYRFGHLLQLQLLTLQWFPFVFWCALRFLREGRVRSLAGVVVFSLLQALSCNYYMVYLALAVILFGLAVVVCARELLTRRKVILLAVGGACVTALCSDSAPCSAGRTCEPQQTIGEIHEPERVSIDGAQMAFLEIRTGLESFIFRARIDAPQARR